jgi:hypothetical protein
MPIPESLSQEQMAKLPAQLCVRCAKEGHSATAVERIDGENLCIYCRDGDPCPHCMNLRAQRRGREAQPTRPPSPAKVTLAQIVSEYQKIDGIDIRYPSEDEITRRFRRRSRGAWLEDLLKAILKSPTGHAEIPVPNGMKAHSLQSTLARHIRAKKLKYTCHCDGKRNSIVVSNAAGHRVAAGGA